MEVFTAGLALALSTLVSICATAHKLPAWVKAWFVRHRLITDIGVFVGVTFLLTMISKSVVSLIGSMFATLAVSLGLEGLVWWEKRRLENGLPPMFGEANPIVGKLPKPAQEPVPQHQRPLTFRRVLRACWLQVAK